MRKFLFPIVFDQKRGPLQLAAFVFCLLTGTAALAAPEFNVQVERGQDGTQRVWLSYLAESNVTALDFAVQLDVPDSFAADVRKCLASIPKTHTGLCGVRGKVLRGVVYSSSNQPLGDTNIGSVVIDPGSMLKAGNTPTDVKVSGVEVTAATPSGNTVSASVRVNGQAAPSGIPGD